MDTRARGTRDGADCFPVGGAESVRSPCVSLRVHPSLFEVAGSNAEGDILLPGSVLRSTEKSSNDEGAFADGQLGLDPITIRKETSGITHIFIKNGDEDDGRALAGRGRVLVEEPSFDYSVSSLISHRLALQPASRRLKEFGEKARSRLEEERQKRKEIVVLDTLPASQVDKSNKGRLPATNPKRKDQLSTRRRLAADAQTPTTSKPTTRKRLAQHVSRALLQPRAFRKSDLWFPNLTHIPIPSRDKRSAFVKLHGLPLGCTPDHIKKFFTGLTVERILLLLSNRVMFPILDASNVAFEHHGEKYLQDQNNQNLLRVLVKFPSASAAALAADRSGETMLSKELNIIKENDPVTQDLPPEAFVIGVTQVSKELAASLFKLTIEALHGSSLTSGLTATQLTLPSNVREILWARAHQECRIIPVDEETRRANLLLVSSAEINNIDPMTLAGYQQLARHYNRLINLQDDLLYHVNGSAANGLVSGFETCATADPALRLTAQACKVLDDEMNQISGMLYQARVARGRSV